MTHNKIYSLLLAGMLAAFFLGLFFAPNDSKVLKDQWQKERKLLMEEVVKKQTRITRLSADSAIIRKKMYEDSVRFQSAYSAEIKAKLYYKRLYEEIDLSRYSVPQLDSLRTLLRSGGSLPPGR